MHFLSAALFTSQAVRLCRDQRLPPVFSVCGFNCTTQQIGCSFGRCSPLSPSALVGERTLTHAPLIPTLTLRVERGASHLKAKNQALPSPGNEYPPG
jgi:hypothetical protein